MGRDLPSNWEQKRKRVYKRDSYECQNCGRKGGPFGDAELHAHHGVPRRKGGSNKMSNLITYCKECHNAIHQNNKTAPTATDNSRVSPDSGSDTPLTWDRLKSDWKGSSWYEKFVLLGIVAVETWFTFAISLFLTFFIILPATYIAQINSLWTYMTIWGLSGAIVAAPLLWIKASGKFTE